MAIALPVLALYAASAKIRGDRIAEANKAAAEAEQAKLDRENIAQYVVDTPSGPVVLSATNPWFVSDRFDKSKILKYRATANDTWQDYTQEKSASTVPVYWSEETSFFSEKDLTPGQMFPSASFADYVNKKGAVQAGLRTYNPDGSFTENLRDKEFWYNTGKTEPGPATEKQSISFTIGENTYTVEGQQGVSQKLTELNIARDKWPTIEYFSTVVKTDDKGNQVGVSQPSKVDLFGTPENPTVPEITIPYFITDQKTDDGTFLEVKQSEYDPAKHGNKTGSFSLTTKGDTQIKRTPMTDIELANASEAIKQSDYLYSFKVGDKVFGGLESVSDRNARILNVANQLNNSPAAITYLKENPDTTPVIGFIRGLFNDVQREHEKLIPVGDELYSVSEMQGRMMIDTVKQSYPSLLAIPGFENLVNAYDENQLSQLVDSKIIQNDDPENTEVTVSAVPVPNPASAVDPSAPQTATQIIQHSWPKTYNPLINRLRTLLLQSNPTGMMVGDKKASRETLVNIAVDNFINYEKGIDGRPLVNSDGNRITSSDQPILFQFNDWANTKFSGDSTVDELSVFMDLIDPRPSALNKQDPRMIPIARDFYTMTDGDILVANNIVYNLMPSSRGVNIAMNKHFGFGDSPSQRAQFLRAQMDVADSSGRAIQVVDTVLDSYYMRDAQGNYMLDARGDKILLDSTAVANLSLFAEGAQYLVGRAADIAGINFGTADSKEKMLGYAQNARIQLMQKVDADGKPLYAENAEGLSLMEQELDRISKITDAKYAERQFYTVVLAYEIAAAIQGGTGGRTISDQDVAMIMRGLRQNFTASPQSQVNTLKGVRRMLERFKFRADALSSGDPKRQLAYITTEQLLSMAGFGNFTTTFTVGSVVDEMGGGGGTAPAGASALQQTIATMEDGEATYNAFVLGSINERLKFEGKPEYNSLTEAKEDMEPTLYGNLVETADRNFINKYGAGQ